MNPFESPRADTSLALKPEQQNKLYSFYVWLVIAVLYSFVLTPADPITMMLAFAYGQLWFIAGALLSLIKTLLVRAIPILAVGGLLLWLGLVIDFHHFFIFTASYTVISIAVGFWAARSVVEGRFRLIGSFSVGYIAGVLFGVIGVVAGSVTALLVMNSKITRSKLPHESVDLDSLH